MNESDIKREVVAALHQRHDQPLSAREIAAALALRGKQAKKLQKWLHELVARGDIVCIRANRYTLGREADLVAGTLDVARSGNGFVAGTGESRGLTVFVSADDMGTALPGDHVLVRIHTERPEGTPKGAAKAPAARLGGKVIRILERSRRDIVGTLRSTGRFLYVVPVDPAYRQDFYVPDARGAALNDRVVVRFLGWEHRHVSPEAEVLEVLGPADDPSVDTISVIRHFGLRDAFPPEVVREAEAASGRRDAPGPRLDLREDLIITIDPERARDFDDALSLTTDTDGRRQLGVHIADVAHFVPPGSALDREAAGRGNSVYFPDKVLPMLPEQLSNGVCSLRPDEDRLAFSVFLTVDAAGQIRRRRFARSIIRSRRRLTYEEAMAALNGKAPDAGSGRLPRPVTHLLKDLDRLAQQMRRQRFARHALDLEVPECEIMIGADGLISGIRPLPSDRSHHLVEECMVAANEAVATELADRGIPALARLHAPPDEAKIEELIAHLVGLGHKPGDLRRRENLAAFLASVKSDPLAWHVRVAVLRSMKRAEYSASATGHFGLAKKFYTHFTSPIRRYPDLVVHRQLAAALHEGHGAGRRRLPYGQEDLGAVAAHCSATEQAADESERAVIEIKKFRFLEQELQRRPVAREAVIVAVTNFGMFVELPDWQLQGLVHISAVSDGFVRHDRKRQALTAGREVFRVGGRVRVRVTGVDFDKRRLDFQLVKPDHFSA